MWVDHTGKNNRFPFLDILGYMEISSFGEKLLQNLEGNLNFAKIHKLASLELSTLRSSKPSSLKQGLYKHGNVIHLRL